ncbi:preprotein translocase subunit YajC [Labedella populi]|uniref:Preprotein translocase subunit YajC n=1 Tax=Labedella populi TaxID=2498850 RepID=A0A444QBK0_9MICO|nr:preprotein translocase subunit YajC [Labedella populi]RWZ61417.1 preprotein translocase subunit YajC [Labedella populi]
MDPLTLGMLAILAVLIFFMFRNGQKRKRDLEDLQSKVVPGAEVMTNFGLFGTIVSINEDDNKVELDIAAGTVVTVHRQTIARVVDDAEPVVAESEPLSEDSAVAADPVVASDPVIDLRTESEKNADSDKKSDD